MAGERILIVDDEPNVLDLCERILVMQGYIVQCASNSHDALQIANNRRFDLLLTDIVLPDMSGLELVEVLKKSYPDLICVTMSGYATMDSAIQALSLGVDEYVLKGFTPKILGQAITKALEKQHPANQVEQLRMQLADLHRQLSKREKEQTEDRSETQFPLVDLGHLTDGIVHDMRNGLGIIRNTIGFLEDDLTDDTHSSDLLKISRSLDFCELVLRNLSALGGQDIFQPQWVNLEDIGREVFFLLERKLVDVDLTMETDPDVPEIMADEGQMKQVFMNLFKNAGEAMPEGGELTLRTRRVGQMLRIEISDMGCGIPPENQERLFKEFFTTKERGYGLGLHIVNTIVQRHGGRIAVESKVGEGTTFILHLPIEAE